jgi:hypothetical protein
MRDSFFQGAFFAGKLLRNPPAKNRAFRGCAIAPAPALRAVAPSGPSNPWRAKGQARANHSVPAEKAKRKKPANYANSAGTEN